MADVLKVIGLMSGTSLDGIDASILDTDGETIAIPGPALTQPYDPATRGLLQEALRAAASMQKGASIPPEINKAEDVLAQAHGNAVIALLQQAGLRPADVAYLGFHGQTVLHRPSERRTWQIGDGARLARATGIAVVNEFRLADVAAGGQGAPFVPLYHQILTRHMQHPVVVVNIGGVANVTYVGAKGELIAFDTGPGNALLDDWMLERTGQAIDRGGNLAGSGKVNGPALTAMLAHPSFLQKPPKSLDRLDFSMAGVAGQSAADGAATLTAFTAAAIARSTEHLPQSPLCWIICGGGRHNLTLMAELRARLAGRVMTAEEAGWDGDYIEAQAFAYLAVRSVRGLALSVPSTTGVPYPMPGGRLHRPTA